MDMNSATTFQAVNEAISNAANYPTKRERDASKRESARLALRRQAWAVANGVSVDDDPFAIFD